MSNRKRKFTSKVTDIMVGERKSKKMSLDASLLKFYSLMKNSVSKIVEESRASKTMNSDKISMAFQNMPNLFIV